MATKSNQHSAGRHAFVPAEERQFLSRVKVLAMDGTALTPMDPRAARKAVRDGVAVGKHIKGEYHVQMTREVGRALSA